jgi:hypothetical protein
VQAPQTRAHAIPSGPITGGSGLPWQTRHSLVPLCHGIVSPRYRQWDALLDPLEAGTNLGGRHIREASWANTTPCQMGPAPLGQPGALTPQRSVADR